MWCKYLLLLLVASPAWGSTCLDLSPWRQATVWDLSTEQVQMWRVQQRAIKPENREIIVWVDAQGVCRWQPAISDYLYRVTTPSRKP